MLFKISRSKNLEQKSKELLQALIPLYRYGAHAMYALEVGSPPYIHVSQVIHISRRLNQQVHLLLYGEGDAACKLPHKITEK